MNYYYRSFHYLILKRNVYNRERSKMGKSYNTYTNTSYGKFYMLCFQFCEMSYLQKKCWTESCQESTSMSMTKIPASPHDEPPILSTQEGSGDGKTDPLSIEEEEVVVLMAIIRTARTMGRTKLEFQYFVSL